MSVSGPREFKELFQCLRSAEAVSAVQWMLSLTVEKRERGSGGMIEQCGIEHSCELMDFRVFLAGAGKEFEKLIVAKCS